MHRGSMAWKLLCLAVLLLDHSFRASIVAVDASDLRLPSLMLPDEHLQLDYRRARANAATTSSGAATRIADVQIETRMLQARDHLFFAAIDAAHGRELWMSDGWSAWLVDDMRPGDDDSSPNEIIEFYSRLYFTATLSGGKVELYWYDLQRLVDRVKANATQVPPTSPSSSSPESVCRFQGLGPDALYFRAFGYSPFSRELFRYTGSGDPVLVSDEVPFREGLFNPTQLTVFEDRLFFAASSVDVGEELWWFDGATAPQLVANLNPSKARPTGSDPDALLATPFGLFFAASNGTGAAQLYVVESSGSPSGNASQPRLLPGAPDPGWISFYPSATVAVASQSRLLAVDSSDLYAAPAVIAGGTSDEFAPEFLTLGPGGTLYMQGSSESTGAELWGWNPSVESFVFLAVDLLYGPESSSPRFLTAFAPEGHPDELLYFGAYENKSISSAGLWVYNQSARPSPPPSPSPSTTASASPTPSISASASSTPSASPSASASASSSPSPSPFPSISAGRTAKERPAYMQVSVLYGREAEGSIDPARLRRGMPSAVVETASMQDLRGLSALGQASGYGWASRLQVVSVRGDEEQVGRLNVLIEVLQVPLDGNGSAVGQLEVLPARTVRQLVDERMLLLASSYGLVTANTTVGLQVVVALGAEEARICPCYDGAWVLAESGAACPQLRIYAASLSVLTLLLAVIVAALAIGLYKSNLATFRGAITVSGAGLQILDFVSDATFVYQLAVESGCEEPVLVGVGLGSIVGALAVNIAVAVFLLRVWPVEGMMQHAGRYWSDVFAVSFLSLFGVKAMDLLSSQLFRRPGLSLYPSDEPRDLSLRRELSHRVRLLSIPQLVVEDAVQLGVQVYALTMGRGWSSNLTALLALVFTTLNVLRHVMGALLSSMGLEALHQQSRAYQFKEAVERRTSEEGGLPDTNDAVLPGADDGIELAATPWQQAKATKWRFSVEADGRGARVDRMEQNRDASVVGGASSDAHTGVDSKETPKQRGARTVSTSTSRRTSMDTVNPLLGTGVGIATADREEREGPSMSLWGDDRLRSLEADQVAVLSGRASVGIGGQFV